MYIYIYIYIYINIDIDKYCAGPPCWVWRPCRRFWGCRSCFAFGCVGSLWVLSCQRVLHFCVSAWGANTWVREYVGARMQEYAYINHTRKRVHTYIRARKQKSRMHSMQSSTAYWCLVASNEISRRFIQHFPCIKSCNHIRWPLGQTASSRYIARRVERQW